MTTPRCKTCGKPLVLLNYVLVMIFNYTLLKQERYCDMDCLYSYEQGQRT